MYRPWDIHFMSMDGDEPVEKRQMVMISTEFSCELERQLHLLNRSVLLHKRCVFTESFGWR